jgi:UDP-N-acetylmuramate: L-alanyl-gamma-D-glutamyl-meso-diaminopimelate ligase
MTVAKEHVHLIGIGGTGMTSLAGLLHESGCRVTGSDRALYPPTSTILSSMGLEVHTGFDPRRLRPAPDLVVVGNAVRRGNPEVEEVLDRRLRHTSMPRVIAERFLDGRHAIVVVGTHGKTTTTAWLAWVLHRAGRDPGFLVGGAPRDFESSFRRGRGPAFVIEGDEYDTAFFDKGPKFMHYRPDTAIVGTVEFDHADIYRDIAEVQRAFAWFVNLVPARGLVVRHEECEATRAVTAHALCRVEGFGFDAGDWRAEGVHDGVEGAGFRLLRGGRHYADVRLALSGDFNVRNALAVAAAAAEQGVPAQDVAAGLATFRGVKRRLEERGVADGVLVIDDFAHHPTAIAETLRAARRRHPGRRLWAILEPRSWSLRRNIFQDRLAASFEAADEVVIAAVFGEAEVPPEIRLDPEAVVRDLGSRGKPARCLAAVPEIVRYLSVNALPGDVIAVLSNGGFGGLHEALLAALEARAAEQGRARC